MLNDDYWYKEINKNTDTGSSSGRLLKTLCSVWFVLCMFRIVILAIVFFFNLPNIRSFLSEYIPVPEYLTIIAAIVALLVTGIDVFIHLFLYKLFCTLAETAIDMKKTKNTNQQMINALHMIEMTLVDTEELLEQRLR